MDEVCDKPATAPDESTGSVSVVTVTYGDRLELLEQVVAACFSDPLVATVHVVSNNSKSDLSVLKSRWEERLKLIMIPRNSGSAAGFGKGIESALEGGSPYIMLLDDDNKPETGCLPALMSQLDKREETVGRDRAAVLALREFDYVPYMQGMKPEWHHPRRGSFLGFSLLQTLQRKIEMRHHKAPEDLPATMSLPHGIYGGLMARRELFSRLGLPNRDLVLYADDVEYTQRVVEAGGTLDLVFGAQIVDLDGRHTVDVSERSIFRAKLKAVSHFRLYYATRNSVWLSKRRSKGRNLAYLINRAIYLFMIRRHARDLGMPPSFDVFMSAVHDGEAGRLGVNDRFPLPE